MSRVFRDGLPGDAAAAQGSLELDLRSYAEAITRDLRDADVRASLRRQIADADSAGDLPWQAWRLVAESVTRRSLQRDDPVTGAGVDRALEMMSAMIWMSTIMDGRAIANDDLDQIVTDALSIARGVSSTA